ncbi:MAG: cytochrome [Pseudonocardia sp. SCN 72-86]|nr:MAG: cytochrome [Pseudonocardia sp. SCN 72-86]
MTDLTTAATTDLPRLPFPRDGVVDVAPLYARLRAAAPVTPVRTPAGDPAWLVTGYDEARALFADPRLGRAHPDPERAARISGSALLGGSIGDAGSERTQHAMMRSLLAPAFSARRMRMLTTRVEGLVATLLDDLTAHGSPADLHEHLSLPLPVLVICELLGVPYADRDRFRAASEGAGGLADREASARAMDDLVAYIRELVGRKRTEPGEDVLSDLVEKIPRGNGAGDAAVARLGAVLLFAGHETTVTRIDVGTLLLLDAPGQWAALAADPGAARAAVEEVLRLAAPSGGGGLPRYAQADVEIAGVTIATGDAVLLAAGVANRDPARFADPDRFDPARESNLHLAFGHGAHYCIGAALARVELEAVFSALPQRFPGLALDVDTATLALRTDLLTGGLDTLPVRW